jgi:hypothetical protein
MDILNFISWIKSGRVVTTVDPTQTLLPVGLKDSRRDDGYLAGAISVEDFANQVGGLQTVAVDGVTITGDGTPGDPLVAAGGSSYKVYTAYISMGDGTVLKLFQNTLGVTLTWSAGLGILTASNYGPLIGQNNVFIQATSSTSGNNAYYIVSSEFSPSPWTLRIEQRDNAGALSSAAYIMVEIRVYP